MLAAFLGTWIDKIIIAAAIAMVIGLVVNSIRIGAARERVKSALNNDVRSHFDPETHEVTEKQVASEVNPDTIRRQQTEFGIHRTWYEVLSQLISLFPLLGILGTVSGLIQNLNAAPAAAAGADAVQSVMDQLVSGMSVAMNSTYWGLIAAIVLKLIATTVPGRLISETENLFEDYDKRFTNATIYKDVTVRSGE